MKLHHTPFLENLIDIIVERLTIIPFFVLIALIISTLIIFRKELKLCQTKVQKIYINIVLVFTFIIVIAFVPIYIMWEDVNYLKKYSKKKLEIDLLNLSSENILPSINKVYKQTIVDGSSTTWQYYVRAGDDQNTLLFLVWLDGPFFSLELVNNDVNIESIYILEKKLIYEREKN